MRRQALYTIFALVVVSLTACSSPIDRVEAEETLKAAHEECVSKSLKSEVPEVRFYFEATYSSMVYDYGIDSEEAPDTVFVKCVSQELFGSDVTSNTHSREDKISYEKSGYDAEWLDDGYFSSLDLSWNKPNFSFTRFDSEYFPSSYYFSWYAPRE